MVEAATLLSTLLNLQGERPLSQDYLQNKKQFQLHTLITEQRHPKTWNLSQTLGSGKLSATADGLRSILSVDEDISQKFNSIAEG